jgi:hypothetical protein
MFPKLELFYRIPENRELIHNLLHLIDLRNEFENIDIIFRLFSNPEYKEALLLLTGFDGHIKSIIKYISDFVELSKIPENKELLYKLVHINGVDIEYILKYFIKFINLYEKSSEEKRKIIDIFISYERGLSIVIDEPELLDLYNNPKHKKIIDKLFETNKKYYRKYIIVLADLYDNPKNKELLDILIDKSLLSDNIISYLPTLLELYTENKEIIDLLIGSTVTIKRLEVFDKIKQFLPKLIEQYALRKPYVIELFRTYPRKPAIILSSLGIEY